MRTGSLGIAANGESAADQGDRQRSRDKNFSSISSFSFFSLSWSGPVHDVSR
jgi:hypothetical protein